MANKIKGITVEIGGETTKLEKALEAVNKQSRSLQSELRGVESLLKVDPTNTELLAQKQAILAQAVESTKEKLQQLKSVQDQVQEQLNNKTITADQYRDFQREIIATEQRLQSLTNQLDEFGNVGAQQADSVVEAMRDVGDEVETVGEKMQDMGSKAAAVGEKMQDMGGKVEAVGKKFMAISAVSAGALVGITKSAIDFETAWTGVTKTVDGTEEQLEKIRQGILDMSEATGSSAEEIAAVAENAGQLGVATDDVLAFTETMVRLGDSTNLSADEASSAIAKLYNIMGGDMDTVDQFGSSIVALGNNMATTEADILNMATRIAGSGNQIGLTEQQVLALAASLSSVGLEAEAGGTAISTIMSQIDKDVAKGSDTLSTWANVAGISVSEFTSLWENDAMGAIQLVVGGLGDASKGGENLNLILEELGITSIRQTDTMKRMSGASDLLTDAVKISNDAWSQNTALTDESNKRYETTAAKLQQLKNTMTELCVSLGDVLLPIVQTVVEGLKGFMDRLTQMSPATQKVVLAVMALVAAIGPVLVVVGKLIGSIGSIMTYGPQIVAVVGTIKTALSGLFATMLANPVGLIIAGIAAVIAALVLLYQNCEWFRDGVNAALETVKTAFNAVVEWFQALPQNLQTWLTSAINTVSTWVADLVSSAVQAGSGFLSSIVDFFQQLPGQVSAFCASALTAVVTWVTDLISNAVQAGSEFLSAIVSFFQQLPGQVSSFCDEAFSAVSTWASNMISSAGQTGSEFLSSIVSFFQQLPGKVMSFLSTVLSTVVTWGGDLAAKGKAAASDLVASIVGCIKELPGKMTEAGKNLVQGLWHGITGMGSWIRDKITGFASGIIDGFKDAFGIASPSKEMAWMGKMLDQGLAQGLERNADDPVGAVRTVTRDVLGAAEADMASRVLYQTVSPTETHPVANDPADNSAILAKLETIAERLNHLKVVTQTGALVGEIIDEVDAALGNRQLLSDRGV